MEQVQAKFNQIVRKNNYWNADCSVLVAVSGGSDSMALLTLLVNLPVKWRPEIHVATVNFDLRAQSEQEVQLVRQFCHQERLAFHTTLWEHPSVIVGMESKARDFRYHFFAEIMQQFNLDILLTAHQADDQAETLLMKLIRSGSIWETTAMATVRDFHTKQLIRPLLNFTKSELLDYLQRKKVAFAIDQTNFTDMTLRNRLRNQIMPLLVQENPQFVQHLLNFTQQQQVALSGLRQYFKVLAKASTTFKFQVLTIDLLKLSELNSDQIILFVQYILHEYLNLDLTQHQQRQLRQMLVNDQATAQLDLTKNWQLHKNYQQLQFRSPTNAQVVNTFWLELNKTLYANDTQKFKIKQSSVFNKQTFYFPNLPQKIGLRHRQEGDVLLLQDGHHQKLKDRLINQKVPYDQRQKLWVITFDGVIVWVEGVYRYQILPTKYLFEIQMGDYQCR
ncbi:tRNA lysidine(34) synthetase TilS [Bombilactobacillus thymidiniphilus]|uniref:tRNA(Ile)-lysidine synthase n=1 Tax=Bombilactobacillus thymidiniphilus TaxID=2923363 RepID=A0ABY4PET1_9LACO|nr:tRNA lysidine(34) synthetase TilS [Bombilactobacillus thymidiniphilus]UQS84021.1 tRNA lysidine(34) synthetase TilS [Bombilactobacillus thymidiniphilus]